ncbi:hypothetical protein Tco_1429753 [Tanacetum coccineum]
MDEEFLAKAYPKVHENLKLIIDERVIEDNPESHSGSMSSMKNLEDTDNFGDQFLYDKPTEDDQEKSKVVNESDSTIPDPSHQTVTSTPPVIAPVIDFSSPKPSSRVTTPPINTEATSITTTLLEITPFIALQLRVAKLEQDMSEVKKTDHSAAVLASIKSQVPTVVDKYLGTKLDDALLRILERHTADLIEKYSVLPDLESIKNQEYKKSPKEIIRIKREQGEKKQESTYTIRTANRNPANHHLYHALMEALIADEDAIDKEVKDRVKDHKRKHDSDDDEDDDDDEGPSAGSNQGKSAKRRRHDSGASGSAQPPPKDDEQSSKKPHDSDASASKQHPTLTLTGWFIHSNGYADNRKEKPYAKLIWRSSFSTLLKPFTRTTSSSILMMNAISDLRAEKLPYLSKLKAARYLDFGLEELVPCWPFVGAWRSRKWLEDEQEVDATTSSQQSRKDYRSGEYFRSWKSFVEEE